MSGASPPTDIELSVVIPVYNEAAILRESVEELHRDLTRSGVAFEIVLAENGSRDGTPMLAEQLAERLGTVSTFSYPEPNYGGALREGIMRARGTFIVCEEIDLCDVDFHLRALRKLRDREADMVIGSKTMPGSNDARPLNRRVATLLYNRMLRLSLGFEGTDTHGLKAFRREPLTAVAARCVVEHDVFASELVIRAQRQGVRVIEIPIRVHEKRAPSVHLLRRVPRVMRNLVQLMASIHLVPERQSPLSRPGKSHR